MKYAVNYDEYTIDEYDKASKFICNLNRINDTNIPVNITAGSGKYQQVTALTITGVLTTVALDNES